MGYDRLSAQDEERLARFSEIAPDLADAISAYARVATYEPGTWSSNERVIMALGAELFRLRAIVRHAGLDTPHQRTDATTPREK
jgi:hypothetical protein